MVVVAMTVLMTNVTVVLTMVITQVVVVVKLVLEVVTTLTMLMWKMMMAETTTIGAVEAMANMVSAVWRAERKHKC